MTKAELQKENLELYELLQTAWEARQDVMGATCHVGREWYEEVGKKLKKGNKYEVTATVSFVYEDAKCLSTDDVYNTMPLNFPAKIGNKDVTISLTQVEEVYDL